MLPFDLSNIALEAAPLLLALAIKGSILLAAALAVVALLRRSTAAVRHAVLTVGLAGAVLLPVLLLTVPPLSIGVLPINSAPPTAHEVFDESTVMRADAPAENRVAPVAEGPQVVPSTEALAGGGDVEGLLGRFAATFGAVRSAGNARATAQGAWQQLQGMLSAYAPDWRLSLLVIWLLGVGLISARWLAAMVSARRLIAAAVPVVDAEWQRAARAAADRLGVSGDIRLLKSERLAVPVVWCFGRSAVVLPADCDEWPAQRRRVVLEHEFAHVARRDGATQVMAQLALTIHWFNPLAWQCYSSFLAERELAADDLVLSGETRGSDYAAHLLHIAGRFRQEPLALLAVAAMARNASLTHRIEMILDPRQRRGTLSKAHVVALACLTAAVLLPLAAFSPYAGPPPDRAIAGVVPSTEAATSLPDDWRWQGTASAGDLVEIYGINGAISVREGSGNTVSVVGTPRGRNAERARLEVNDVRGGVVICVVYPGQRGCEPGRGPSGRTTDSHNATVNLEVVVPARVRLKARTTNGAVRTDQLSAAVDVGTTNGSIETGSRTGEVRAASTNGAITLTAAGRTQASTTNGSITITSPGPVDARTTNGTIDVRFIRTDWSGNSRLSTTNGGLRVELPAGANVTVDANASNSSIRTDFGDIDVQARRRYGPGATARGTIGAGGRSLELRTTNGGIRISRASRTSSSRGVQREGAAGTTASIDHTVDTAMRDLDELMEENRVATGDLREWAAAFGQEFAALSQEVGATVAEAMSTVDWEAITLEVAESLEDARVDIRAEVLEALEEARRDLEHERTRRTGRR